MGRGRIGFAEGRGQELPLHYASDAATGTRAGASLCSNQCAVPPGLDFVPLSFPALMFPAVHYVAASRLE